jgi:flagella basal body P-ring formation protein FlgA
LKQSDLELSKTNISRLNRGYFTDLKEVVGMQLKRRFRRGEIITPHMVKAPKIVKRGDIVPLVAKKDRFYVKMKGKALMNGAEGERIRVKNLSSSRIIEGKVQKNGDIIVMN